MESCDKLGPGRGVGECVLTWSKGRDRTMREGGAAARRNATRRWRVGLAVSAAAAALTVADAAHAQFFDSMFRQPSYGYGYGYGYRARPIAPAGPYYQKPQRKKVDTAKKDPAVKPV